MDAHHTIYTIDDSEDYIVEPVGMKRKLWFDGGKKLFKVGRPGTGENWAEVIVSEICCLLDLPHAIYRFAKFQTYEGVITRNFVPDRGQLILGNQLIFKNSIVNPKEYSVGRLFALFKIGEQLIKLPPLNPRVHNIILKPADLFTGYMLLDALVGNHDRHWENWGVIADIDANELYLAPTFDHASSLGRELLDQKRKYILGTKDRRCDIKAYAIRGKTPFYGAVSLISENKRLNSFDVFKFFYEKNIASAEFWLSKLNHITESSLTNIFEPISNQVMSDSAKLFALKLILVNKELLLSMSK